jgi:hypothetical protein
VDALPTNLARAVSTAGLAGAAASDQVAKREQVRKAEERRAVEPDRVELQDASDAPVARAEEPDEVSSDLPRQVAGDAISHVDIRA